MQPSSTSPYLPQDPHSHPAPHLGRSQSGRAPSAADVYGAESQQPSVNIIPPTSHQNLAPQTAVPVPGQTQFGQSRNVRSEKENKKSKRHFISGVFKDKGKDDDKDRDNKSSDSRRGVGRSSSVHLLRKTNQDYPQNRESYSQQNSPQQYQPRHSVLYPGTEPLSPSQASIEAAAERYQNPSGHSLDRFESSHPQHSQPPIDYHEDGPSFSPQQETYQPYRQDDSSNVSEHYLPYQGQPTRPVQASSDQYSQLRPPSQASLAPPSPVNHPLPSDTRVPSGPAPNRFSTQITAPAPPPQPSQQMARDREGPSGSVRQQREPRNEEIQYQSQQDPRVRMSQQVSADQGRSTPPPRSRDDINQLDYHQLLQRHEELQAKYSKVKRYYFEREAQVTQLQNTVANQRLSMSKTSLDDSQYTARFERLSNAINNLAFNIRKNWRAVPPWLRHVCNQDAHSVGTKEMTAVGRACISRWLFESIFERTFHPGIDPGLSAQLKHVEKVLRRSSQGIPLTDEQRDDLTTKITTWRLTTIEGLQDVLESHQAEQYIETMNKVFTHQLTESLKANLTEPPPPDLAEGVAMIVSQAIGIARNIPCESRDICVEYFMPGTPINEVYMKLEPQMTPLTNPGPDERLMALQAQQAMQDAQDAESTASTDDAREREVEAEIREAAGKAAGQPSQVSVGSGRNESATSSASQGTVKGLSDKSSKKSSFLGGFVSKKPAPSSRNPSNAQDRDRGNDAASNNSSERETELGRNVGARESMAVNPAQLAAQVPGANQGRIRFAAFVAIEVRGKGGPVAAAERQANKAAEAGSATGGSSRDSSVNVLFKAPVYEY